MLVTFGYSGLPATGYAISNPEKSSIPECTALPDSRKSQISDCRKLFGAGKFLLEQRHVLLDAGDHWQAIETHHPG